MSWYIEIHTDGNRIVILNPRYTREEIREKLAPFRYDKEFVDIIVNGGVYLEKPLTMRTYDDEEGLITSENPYWKVYVHWGYKITVHPDTSFKVEPPNTALEILYNLKIIVYNVWWFFNKYILRNSSFI